MQHDQQPFGIITVSQAADYRLHSLADTPTEMQTQTGSADNLTGRAACLVSAETVVGDGVHQPSASFLFPWAAFPHLSITSLFPFQVFFLSHLQALTLYSRIYLSPSYYSGMFASPSLSSASLCQSFSPLFNLAGLSSRLASPSAAVDFSLPLYLCVCVCASVRSGACMPHN